ncbi:single-stranded DNA-binding protein [Enterococcus hirae]|uniref:single-stranded DNA-binding protein n=1 Tax=Enterococcus TaxID=1350 RepID=UPI000F5059E3|nr:MULTISPECIES: single-stranded DNA-binding protein [Enterococcus]MCH1975613.1 single-stranded DNA-binding protein [Enterococcus hirae]MCH1976389.1 single-stranded DNA-binding protein [Enterococcus hirae]MCH1976602.1 single-stranded DNA-binding protein [Enterococcus hirae]ROX39315.1 single-stranded DNA-binding protein [Enterococcus faecium]UQR33321.1 single-stranded DNA-binding protein [Enterococcus hirae]
MINTVTLVGRLTKDPELRTTTSGTGVATFTLAVNRDFKDANGNREADFINCVAWRKTAEILANYAKKGSLVGLIGRIQTRSYENQQGNRVFVTEVVVERFNLLESRSNNDTGVSNNQTTNYYKGNNQNSSNDLSHAQNNQSKNVNSNPFDGSSMNTDLELPF